MLEAYFSAWSYIETTHKPCTVLHSLWPLVGRRRILHWEHPPRQKSGSIKDAVQEGLILFSLTGWPPSQCKLRLTCVHLLHEGAWGTASLSSHIHCYLPVFSWSTEALVTLVGSSKHWFLSLLLRLYCSFSSFNPCIPVSTVWKNWFFTSHHTAFQTPPMKVTVGVWPGAWEFARQVLLVIVEKCEAALPTPENSVWHCHPPVVGCQL